ncbi:N-acetylmuramoyl-L-alanine amidase [Cytophagaceae bacterium 50C-KIRBA]|uniref:N-acetylmuramoyl-L-alanine amidase n=1 Tax=Aquirufa beregesia TaxID=2516556 RepID=A0ABX0EVM3_9BACT|nr:N-acetylmuramoyl-L-alanine amidase [Aquirufa beregesia]NGZ43895.1 N-acetylmuramoyl-L-alanine amidase [Aquirufa beregesia]
MFTVLRAFVGFALTCLLIAAIPSPPEPTRSAKRNLVKTICLDAGHGGKDPGCLGPKGAQEGKVTLKIILEVGKRLKSEFPDLKVVYTRDTDDFIELNERANIANRSRSDLFISVHCNAATNKAAYGTETYTMGLHKTDGNLNVAKRENSVILQEKDYQTTYNGFDPSSPLAHIMMANYQSAFMASSVKFASKVEEQFAKVYNRKSFGVKQAGFLVIWRTAMPSVLIETGFLTNPEEEGYLNSEKGQSEVADAIIGAFKKYKEEIEK